jgi:transcriptional regulator with XRE-family HTH domain
MANGKEINRKAFAEALPPLLMERKLSLRGLAQAVGGVDHAYLSRMLRGDAPVHVGHAERIARYLELPPDFFPEIREAQVFGPVRADPKLRDKIHRRYVQKRRASKKP